MYFVSNVHVFPLVLPIISLLISTITTSAGISGAFLLLPFQVSVLHINSPSVSATNLIYNIIAIPGGLLRFLKEKRINWSLTFIVCLGTLPGSFLGVFIRIYYLPNPKVFKLLMSILFLGLTYQLASNLIRKKIKLKHALKDNFKSQTYSMKSKSKKIIKTQSITFSKITYKFGDETYSYNTILLFFLSLFVGVIGGIYGIGGGSIISPFCVSILELPIYTIAGACLASTFITSIAGITYYQVLSTAVISSKVSIAPDWHLGILFGLGGLAGTYLGAYLQKFIPEKTVNIILIFLVAILSFTYISQFFTS